MSVVEQNYTVGRGRLPVGKMTWEADPRNKVKQVLINNCYDRMQTLYEALNIPWDGYSIIPTEGQRPGLVAELARMVVRLASETEGAWVPASEASVVQAFWMLRKERRIGPAALDAVNRMLDFLEENSDEMERMRDYDQSLTCKICGKTLGNMGALTTHMRQHKVARKPEVVPDQVRQQYPNLGPKALARVARTNRLRAELRPLIEVLGTDRTVALAMEQAGLDEMEVPPNFDAAARAFGLMMDSTVPRTRDLTLNMYENAMPRLRKEARALQLEQEVADDDGPKIVGEPTDPKPVEIEIDPKMLKPKYRGVELHAPVPVTYIAGVSMERAELAIRIAATVEDRDEAVQLATAVLQIS